MRKQLVVLSLILGGAVAGSAAPEAPKGRYLVATRRPAREARLNVRRDLALQRFESVNAVAAELTEAEVAELRASSEVLFIEPDYERHAIGFVSDGPGSRVPGRESMSGESVTAAASTQAKPYGIEMVAAPLVWNVGRGRTIRVGIVDTGVNGSHPDLVDDYKGGRDFIENDDVPNDDNGHGTHVAGTIGALDNDYGVVGVAPNVEIYGLRVLNGAGTGSTSNIIRAIDWAIQNKLHVLNLSLGSPNSSVVEEQAFQRAADAGIITVAASGNDFDESAVEGLAYPAGYSTVLSVGAIDDAQAIAAFSQRGSALKVVAPGVRVLSTAGTVVDVTAGPLAAAADLLEGSPRGSLTGEFVDSGYGRPGDFPAAVSGRIALIQRGAPAGMEALTFREKVQNAKKAGAFGAIIYNNREEPLPNWTLVRDASGELIPEAVAFPWPVTVGITQKDGQALLRMAGATVTIGVRADGYEMLSGTSMASPHVAGVVALLLSVAPGVSPVQVRQAIIDGAVDLGAAGFDTTFGNGVVNAYNAARRLAPEKFAAPPARRRGARQ